MPRPAARRRALTAWAPTHGHTVHDTTLTFPELDKADSTAQPILQEAINRRKKAILKRAGGSRPSWEKHVRPVIESSPTVKQMLDKPLGNHPFGGQATSQAVSAVESLKGDKEFGEGLERRKLKEAPEVVNKIKQTITRGGGTNFTQSVQSLNEQVFKQSQRPASTKALKAGFRKQVIEGSGSPDNAQLIASYNQVLQNAGLAPLREAEPTDGDVKAYRREVRKHIVDTFSSILNLDAKVLTQPNDNQGFVGSIFEAWVKKYHLAGIAKGKPVFLVGDQQVIPDAVYRGQLIEIKTRRSDEGPSPSDIMQMQKYRAILGGLKAKDGPFKNKTFRQIVYIIPRAGTEQGTTTMLDKWRQQLQSNLPAGSWRIQVAR